MATLHDLRARKNGYRGKKRFQVAYTDAFGVRRRKNFESRNDAKKFQATIELQLIKLREGLLPEDYTHRSARSNLTVGEVFRLLKERKIDLKEKPSARSAAITQLSGLVARFKDIKIALLTVQMINDWKVERLKAGLDVVSVKNYLTAFKNMFKWAVDEGHLSRSPLADLKIPKSGPLKTKKTYLELEEIQRLLDRFRLNHPTLYDYLLFLINTGVRIGEALSLEWSQIDMARHTVFIPREKNKTNTERKFEVNDAVMTVLRRLHRDRPFGSYVFARYTESSLVTKFGDATESILGVRVKPHVCRKTWATNLRRGKPITGQDGKTYWVKVSQHVVAKLGGWKPDSSTLLRIYQQSTEGEEAEAVHLFSIGLDEKTAPDSTRLRETIGRQYN